MRHAPALLRRLLAVLICWPLLVLPVGATSLEEAVDVTLLPGWRLADGRHMAAVEIRLAPGWKTYWRAPGDAGIPPRFDWHGSGNLGEVKITWPTPKIMDQGGMQVIGYDTRLILPLTVTPRRAGQDVRLSGSVDLGVCRDVCLPVTLPLEQVLPVATVKRDARIASALADRPYSASEGRVSDVACQITPIEGGVAVRANVALPKLAGREVAVIETANPELWVAQGKTRREGGRVVTETQVYHVDGRAFALDRSGLRITVIGSGQAVEVEGCPAK